MVGLPCGEKNYDNIYQTVSIEYWYETDGQTDRQTDGQNCYINIARQCADAR